VLLKMTKKNYIIFDIILESLKMINIVCQICYNLKVKNIYTYIY